MKFLYSHICMLSKYQVNDSFITLANLTSKCCMRFLLVQGTLPEQIKSKKEIHIDMQDSIIEHMVTTNRRYNKLKYYTKV